MNLVYQEQPIWKRAGVIFGLALIGGMLFFLLSFLQKPVYEGHVELLLVQETYAQSNAYTTARTTEYYGRILAQVMDTDSFIHAVTSREAQVGAYGMSESELKKNWNNQVGIDFQSDTGILTINVQDTDRTHARNLLEGIKQTVQFNQQDYTGSRNTTVRVLDGPVTDEQAHQAHLARNTAFGVVLALLACVLWALAKANAVVFRSR